MGFIELLMSRHLVRFGTWSREEITPSIVWKKGAKKKHVQLVTGEGLANLEVETGEIADDAGLSLGQADVNDAFHRLGMPSLLPRYFGYPVCTAKELKKVGETVDGVKLQAGDVVYPLARSLTVGFAWSLWICQQIGESLCRRPVCWVEVFLSEIEVRAR